MRAKAGPTFTPDAAKATDATVDMSERNENARRLVRGEDARETAKDALIRASESHDEHDTGSQLPGDAAHDVRNFERLMRRARRKRGEGNGEPEAGDSAHEGVGTTSANDVGTPATNDDMPTVRHRLTPNDGKGANRATAPRGSNTRVLGDGMRARFRVVTGGESAERSRESSRQALARYSGMRRMTSQPLVTKRGVPTATNVTPRPVTGASRSGAARPVGTIRLDANRQAMQRTIAAGRRAGSSSAAMASRGAAVTTARSAGAAAATSEGTVAMAPIAAVALALLVIVLVAASILAGGAVDEDQRAGAHRLAQVAADEYLAGESRGDYGYKGLAYSAYVRGAYGGKRDWDVCLVGWCMKQARFVDAGLTSAYGDVSSYINHFRHDPKLGEVHDWYGETYVPVEGDLFVSWYADGTQHIGIVTGCDGTRFETVEGDVAGGPNNLYDLDEEDGLGGYVARRTRTLGEYSYTFIHPLYSEDAASKA